MALILLTVGPAAQRTEAQPARAPSSAVALATNDFGLRLLRAVTDGKVGKEMIVDHPFFCAIVEQQSGVMLFAGVVTDPSER